MKLRLLLFIFIFSIYFWLCWGFIAAHKLSLAGASGALLVVVRGLLTAAASLVAEQGPWAPWLSSCGAQA